MDAYDPWGRPADRTEAGGGFGPGLVTLVIGAVLGAVMALLLAPKSGKDLRTQVAEQAGDWKSHAADALAQGRERVVSAVETDHAPPPNHDKRSEEKISPKSAG